MEIVEGHTPKCVTSNNTVRLCVGEVKGEVEELLSSGEEEGAGAPPETMPVPEDNRLGYEEDIIPEAESAAAAIRRGPLRLYKGGKGSR
jgi:hypothetical protein